MSYQRFINIYKYLSNVTFAINKFELYKTSTLLLRQFYTFL